MNITRKNIVYDDYIKVIYNNHPSTVHDVYIQNPENTHINDQVQLPLHIVSSHNNSNNYTEHDNVSFRRHSMPLPPEYIAKPQSPNKIRRISRLVKQDISNIDTTYARRTSQSTPTTPPTPIVSRRTSVNQDLDNIIANIEDNDTVKIFNFTTNIHNRRYSESSL